MRSPSSETPGPAGARSLSEPPPPARGLPQALPLETIDAVVLPALEEDRGRGDLTTDNVVPQAARARARLVAKADGCLAGLTVFSRVFEICAPGIEIELLAADGDACRKGDELMRLRGDARGMLVAERTALNLLQHMSGVATATAALVALAGEGARILDTRKTLPGLRCLEKYAVRCGGGENHRFGLYDEAMVKENHLDLAGQGLTEVVEKLRGVLGAAVRITAEARDEAEAFAAVRGGADVVMLDNMSPAQMSELCPRLRAAAQEAGNTIEVEASGNLNEDTIAAAAASGVDRLSVGAVTHSAPALDLSLYLQPERKA